MYTPNPRSHRAASNRKIRRAHMVQPLEARLLLAQINVQDYGAIPNDGGDDRAAIINAINHSSAGDTIFFPAGTYNVSSEIASNSSGLHVSLGDGRIYEGVTNVHNGTLGTLPIDSQSILIGAGSTSFIFHLKNSNATFHYLTFQGQAIFMDTPDGSMVDGVTIDNNLFNILNGGDGVEFTTGLSNSVISNNVFNPITGDTAVYGYDWNNLTINNNEFLNGNEGIHLTGFRSTDSDLLIEQNYFSGLHRIGIEYQGTGINTIVQDNFYENPVVSSDRSQNGSTFAYSIVADQSVGTIVRRNTSICPTPPPDGIGVRIIFELGGQNCTCTDNYSVNGNNVVAVNGFHGTASVTDNLFMGYLEGVQFANGATGTVANNGPSVNLTWDINRARPMPNIRYSGTEIISAPNAPTGLAASNVGTSEIDFSWTDTSSNESGFYLEQLASDGVSWLVVATLNPNTTSYALTGMAAGQTNQFRVRAFNSAGSAASSPLTVKTPVLNTTTPTTPSRPTRPVFTPRGGSPTPITPPLSPIS